MRRNHVQTPHDALFKLALGDPEHAASMLRSALPDSETGWHASTRFVDLIRLDSASKQLLAPLMVRVMTAPNGLAALGALLNHAISVSDVDLSALRTLVAANVGKTVEEAVMTTAERLHQQGLSQGRTEGHASALLKQLTLKFGALSQGVSDRVQGAAVAELDLWTERVLSAQSLDEVLR